jgi:tetratricopeptide (TPR) repeat protein
MAELERVLLPQPRHGQRQKIYVLRGLGGIGKTQLAVEFARRHHHRFSSVLWLDGRSEDGLKRSIASYAGRIPKGQILETSRLCAGDSSADVDAVVKDVMTWFARPDNSAWLLIFDNVDLEYKAQGGDPDAYDVRRYLSGADHGSVLVTTRLARLEQLGKSQQLGKVSKGQGQAIFEGWYKRKYGKLKVAETYLQLNEAKLKIIDTAENERLLALLDGLPLAIAQAGAYLQESGVGLTTYLRFYERQWSELMQSDLLADAPLQDYPDRSVWTTWAISYQAIRDRHEATANLLLLWSFLDNKGLWYGLFAATCKRSTVAARMLSELIGDIASSEIRFSGAMQLLRNYSLVEEAAETTKTASYTTHPVVHQWAHHSQGKCRAIELSRLALVTVGQAVPESATRDYSTLQRRLLPHVQAFSSRIVKSEVYWWVSIDKEDDRDIHGSEEQQTVLDAVHRLGALYANQGKLSKAEQMYERALRGYEGVLGPTHTSTLVTVNNLGLLYADQDKLDGAEQMYERALRGFEEALGPTHTSTLATVNNLGTLYKAQGKLSEAEQMFERALRGYEEALTPTHTSRLGPVNNLGNLGILYAYQGKLSEAEQMYKRALRGYEEALGSDDMQQYRPALNTLENIGDLYVKQAESVKAQVMYARALSGLSIVLGQSSESCMKLAAKINALPSLSRQREGQSKLPTVVERSAPQHDRTKKSSRLPIRKLAKN